MTQLDQRPETSITTTQIHRLSPTRERCVELEHDFARLILMCVAIAIPALLVVWVGLVALAVQFDGASLQGPLLMGAAVGVLAGLVFGTWTAFVSCNARFDDADCARPNDVANVVERSVRDNV